MLREVQFHYEYEMKNDLSILLHGEAEGSVKDPDTISCNHWKASSAPVLPYVISSPAGHTLSSAD